MPGRARSRQGVHHHVSGPAASLGGRPARSAMATPAAAASTRTVTASPESLSAGTSATTSTALPALFRRVAAM